MSAARGRVLAARRAIAIGALGALVVVLAMHAVASAAPPTGQRLKTGQRKCWSATGDVLSCAPTAQDGALRRGVARAYVDQGDGTITDTQTGLVWEKLADAGGAHDQDATSSWTAALAKVAALNRSPCLGGHCDWRLPNVNELQSLVDYGRRKPAVSPAFADACATGCAPAACSCTAAAEYWSASSYAPDASEAWAVDFVFGDVVHRPKGATLRVRAVRGGD